MTARVLAVNVAGATDRLTLHGIYRVVEVLPDYVVVIDDRGERTKWLTTRFTPLPVGTRKEERVRG